MCLADAHEVPFGAAAIAVHGANTGFDGRVVTSRGVIGLAAIPRSRGAWATIPFAVEAVLAVFADAITADSGRFG